MWGRLTENPIKRVQIPLGSAAIAVWPAAQVLTMFTFPLKDVVVATLMVLSYSAFALAHMLGYSVGIVLRVAPDAKDAEFRRLLMKDLWVCVKTGTPLMINMVLMPFTIPVVEIATRVQFPSGQFRILLPFITAVLMLTVACIVLPERNDHCVSLKVKLRIDPHDMLLVALPVIGGALIDIPIAIAFAYAIYPHLIPPLTPPVKLAIIVMTIILIAIPRGLYLIGKERVRSEKVREEYEGIVFAYVMITIPLIISLLWGEGIITITLNEELLKTLAVFAPTYIPGYFATTNYLRYTGLITENNKNQKETTKCMGMVWFTLILYFRFGNCVSFYLMVYLWLLYMVYVDFL